jgi:hypothetical protein
VPRLISLLLVTGLVTGCAARAASPEASPDVEARVRAHMQFLASDALNGRGSGTRDEWLAATFVASHFARLGLLPLGQGRAFVHTVTIERAEVNAPPTLRAGGRTLTHATEILVTTMAAPQLTGALQKYRDGTAVRAGAVLLLPTTNPPGAAVTAPAAMVLSLETEVQQKRRLAGADSPFPPLRMQWVVGTPRRAAIALEKSVYDDIAALADGTDISLTADVKPAERASTWNAVAQLPGTSAEAQEEIVVLSAHHDHVGSRAGTKAGADTIFNGADDDASGTVAVMELAEALARQRLRRTVIFATFGSEETGGQGSSHFIDASGVDLTRVVANLQFEMIGRPDPKVPPQTLWLTGYERSDLGEALARQGARLVADPHPEQSFFTRSDNIRFARRGVVAHTVSSFGLHKDYHQPGDEIARIDFAHMTRAIQSLVRPVRWLASSSFIPQWKPGMRP